MGIDFFGAIVWGFAATTILTIILRGSQAAGLTRMDLPLVVGLMVTAERDHAKVYGFLIHLGNGWIFSFVYVAIFESLHRATWWLGSIVGFTHGIFVLAVGLSAIPGLHPRMASEARGPEPTRDLEPPGFMGLNYGRGTPLVTLAGHVIFGFILGVLYQVR
jgi:uncharacterized membrane protein YagU involved in acid resistance